MKEMSESVYVEKVGSCWWILKHSKCPNTHICGNFNHKTKREAIKWAECIGHKVK